MSEAETIAAQAAAANNAVDLDQQPHDRRDIEVLYKIYVEKRLESQSKFYESRVRENQSNADFTFTVGTAVMAISAFVATVSALINSPVLSLLSAILPAFAALLAAFRQLYGWERQISIYRDALMGLERVKLMTPDKDRMPLTDLPAIYPKLVTSTETVFTGEVNQWGQFVQNADKNAQEPSNDTRVTNALMSDLHLSDEQIATIRKIVAAGTPKAAFSQQTITVHPEETSALPSGGNNAQAAPPSAPRSVTTTRTDSTTIHPDESSGLVGQGGSAVDAQNFSTAASTPIAVTTTHTESTVVEHLVPSDASSEAAPVAQQAPITEPYTEHPSEAQSVGEQEPYPETMDALTPGAAHVDAPQASDEIDTLINHQEATNEPPPPEAFSALTPGSMHVDAPQAPPENPDLEEDLTANG
jgi:hypothetical protein